MTIALPREPSDKNYEACVAAVLTAQGYFTECNMVLKEDPGAEILELDVVATPSNQNYLCRTVLEAKSGRVRIFNELFKLYGWKQYLGLASACLVHARPSDPAKQAAVTRFSRETQVRAAHLDTGTLEDRDTLMPACFPVPGEVRTVVTKATWWHRIAERLIGDQFTKQCKSIQEAETERARAYRFKVDAAFFARTPLQRAGALYSLYQEYPKIASEMIEYVAEKGDADRNVVTQEVRNTSRHLWVQHLMAMEAKCRVAIVKNAFDHILEGTDDDATMWDRLFEQPAMPGNFHLGMQWLRDHEHRYRIPYLLQAFVDVFGGFLFKTDEDLNLMAMVTGVPADAILPALESLDRFFPFPGGWLLHGKGNMVLLKMLPAYIRGVGCFLRQGHYQVSDYRDRWPTCAWYMATWHNSLYQVLEPHLGRKPEK